MTPTKPSRDFIKENRENPLFEMAGLKEDYECILALHALNLYNHLLYICSIGYIESDLIAHWCREILTRFTSDIASFKLKSSVRHLNLGECVERRMMANLMGVNFEDYDIDDYINALTTLKVKLNNESSRETDNAKKTTHLLSICKRLLSNNDLAKYVEPNKPRLIKFYKDLVETANTRNPEYAYVALNEFLENAPRIKEN